MEAIKVLILMGSRNDMPIMEEAAKVLAEYRVPSKMLVRSAHRTGEATVQAIREAEAAGCQVFICGAGMAAHLAGVVASKTVKPVIGVPLASGALNGQDALYSTVMMPPGIPVATVAIDGAKNAALLAVQMLAQHDPDLRDRLLADRAAQAEAVLAGH